MQILFSHVSKIQPYAYTMKDISMYHITVILKKMLIIMK
jgi:hypothetical protein